MYKIELSGTAPFDLIVNIRLAPDPLQYKARHSIVLDNGFMNNYGDSYEARIDPSQPVCVPLSLGTDGHPLPYSTEYHPITKDAYGFSLHYYAGDYKAIGARQSTSLLTPLRETGLFNGNIAAMAVNVPQLGNPLVYNYHYDQLNRLVTMDAYSGLASTGETVTFSPLKLEEYKERFSYDPDGGITKLYRRGAGKTIDSATWYYNSGTHQLNHIKDPAGRFGFDAGVQQTNNYGYTEIGEMKRDVERGITDVSWDVYGKISSQTINGATIFYTYDAGGNRICKKVGDTTEVYVRDVNGNVLAIYKQNGNVGKLIQSETYIYGATKLGLLGEQKKNHDTILLSNGAVMIKITNETGNKIYDLIDHRGNILASLSDKRTPIDSNSDGQIDYYLPVVVNAQDYSSFGSLLDKRQYGNTPRYTYNGKELDNETGWQEYGMRNYLVDIPIFTKVDPLTNEYPELTPYQFAGNTPIQAIDLDGLEPAYIYKDRTTGRTVLTQTGDHFQRKIPEEYKKDFIKSVGKPGPSDGKQAAVGMLGAIGIAAIPFLAVYPNAAVALFNASRPETATVGVAKFVAGATTDALAQVTVNPNEKFNFYSPVVSGFSSMFSLHPMTGAVLTSAANINLNEGKPSFQMESMKKIIINTVASGVTGHLAGMKSTPWHADKFTNLAEKPLANLLGSIPNYGANIAATNASNAVSNSTKKTDNEK